jgi:hypothetical protein
MSFFTDVATMNIRNSIYRVRPTVRASIIMRCKSNYKPSISNPICRKGNCSISMRRIRSRQCYTHTILCTTITLLLGSIFIYQIISVSWVFIYADLLCRAIRRIRWHASVSTPTSTQGNIYTQQNLLCLTVIISCVQFDNFGLKLLRCVIGQEYFQTVNMSSGLHVMCTHSL